MSAARFLSDNPTIDVIQYVTNRAVDLVKASIDIAIRGHAATLSDSSFVEGG